MFKHTFILSSTNARGAARRTAGALVLATALGASLVACGGSDDSSSGSSGMTHHSSSSASPSGTQTASNGDVYNDADVQFATQMVPHHQQALLMAQMAEGRQLDPEVQQLVEAIKAAQGPEIETMTGWLTAWGKPVPSSMPSASGDMSGHGMSSMGGDDSSMGSMGGDGSSMGSEMPGMMSDEDMAKLQSAPNGEFQKMWLEMMVAHHKGAIDMAQDEEKNGAFPDAVALAKSIATSQQQEVTQMEQLLS